MLMYMLGDYILVLSVALSALVGFIVSSRNLRNRTHQIYAGLTISIIVLSVANYLSLEPSSAQGFLVRTVMAACSLGILMIYLLVASLKYDRRSLFRSNAWIVLFTIGIVLLNYTNLVFTEILPGSPAQPVPGPGAILFLIHFLTIATLLVHILVSRLKTRNLKETGQYRLIIAGLMPIVVLAPFTGFVLPLLYQVTSFIILTPLYTFFFVCCVGYAMIRHGLFDIRRAAIRSLAYAGVIVTLSILYYLLVYSLSYIFASGSDDGMVRVSPISVAIALVLGFLFQPIRTFFDDVTNKIFYRNSYATEVFFSQINSLLVSNTDLRSMLTRTASVINEAMHARQVYFYIFRKEDTHRDIIVGAGNIKRIPRQDALELNRFIEDTSESVVAVDDLDRENTHIRRLLTSHRIDMAVPLVRSGEILGYLCMGEKKSRTYTTRDMRVLRTLSDELTIAIQNALAVQQVKDLNENLQQRIDDATKELRRSNAQLQRLDEAKDEFVSMASHQLRTPLTSVKGYIDMVLQGDVGEITDMQKHLLSEAFTSSERMVHLINDFLNVSRLQTGKFIIEKSNTNIQKLVKQEVDALQMTAKQRDLSFKLSVDTSLPNVMIDEGKVRQVMMNFLDNSMYYSKANTTIAVTLKNVKESLEFTVTDTGIGVPEKEQTHLFTKFYRASNARKQRPDGTGVGLFLSKKVIAAHGGSMIFSSKEGKGSTFGFSIPMKKIEVSQQSTQ